MPQKKQLISFAGLLAWVIISSVIVFSPGFLGFSLFSGGLLAQSFTAAFAVFNLLLLLYGSYALLLKEQVRPALRELQSTDDFIVSLKAYRRSEGLQLYTAKALDQLGRLDKKNDSLQSMLAQKFQSTELSYGKFMTVIKRVETLCLENIRKMLNRFSALEASDYGQFLRAGGQALDETAQERATVFNQYTKTIDDLLQMNEDALLKFDRLLFEVSNLDVSSMGAVEDMSCIVELEQLIEQTKLYKA